MLLQVRRYGAGTVDAHGNTPSVLGTAQPWTVRALAPGSMDETLIGRDSSSVAWTVYADKTAEIPHEFDVVVVDAVEFTVDGRPKDWTFGPVDNPTAGVVVELRRVEG